MWLHNKKLVMSDQKMPNQGPGSSILFNSSEAVSSPPKFDYDAVERRPPRPRLKRVMGLQRRRRANAAWESEEIESSNT